MTEAAYWGWIRSQLRGMSQRWQPIYQAINDGKQVATTADKKRWGNRIKYVYVCEACGDRVSRKEIQADHRIPCGSLKSYDDIGPFVKRLLVEKDGIDRICKPCHTKKTEAERKERLG